MIILVELCVLDVSPLVFYSQCNTSEYFKFETGTISAGTWTKTRSVRSLYSLEGHPSSPIQLRTGQNSGAPNENIVQNHLNIALLNVF